MPGEPCPDNEADAIGVIPKIPIAPATIEVSFSVMCLRTFIPLPLFCLMSLADKSQGSLPLILKRCGILLGHSGYTFSSSGPWPGMLQRTV
jgi:hypothetical protein